MNIANVICNLNMSSYLLEFEKTHKQSNIYLYVLVMIENIQ